MKRIKDVRAPGFQGFTLHHGGEGTIMLRARLSNGRVLETTVDAAVVGNLRAARMERLEEEFSSALRRVYPSVY